MTDLLERFQLDPARKASNLSKGQKTQLALIGAVCPEPELLVLDEPTLQNGTLWIWGLSSSGSGGTVSEREQIWKGSDWVAVAVDHRELVAIKADGSLWKSNFIYSQNERRWLVSKSPVRLGSHNDWVAISGAMDGLVSLAADGSLWYWWNRDRDYDEPLLAVSRKPAKIENNFGNQERASYRELVIGISLAIASLAIGH